MQSEKPDDPQPVRPRVGRPSKLAEERREASATARKTLLDKGTIPRGRIRERQDLAGVHVYDERALSHFPESELYLDEIPKEEELEDGHTDLTSILDT
jgi:hypothetical protein